MLIESLPVGPFAVNAFIVAGEPGGDAALIDPGDEVDRIEARVRELGVTPRAVLCTHAHLAHVAHSREVAERFDVDVHLHAEDRFLLAQLPERLLLFGLPPNSPPEIGREIEHGQRLELGTLEIEVVHTPGHSPGSVCFWAPAARTVFTGDTLFRGAIGRTDVPGGSQEQLLESIRGRLFALGDDAVVHSGHGTATTIGEERVSNPFVNGQLLG